MSQLTKEETTRHFKSITYNKTLNKLFRKCD